ncbi:unnamed protein product, partial [Ixodes hexagonus]
MAVPGGSQETEGAEEMDYHMLQKFTIGRIPRNMHPTQDKRRWKAPTAALARSWDTREGTLYVDAAGPANGVAMIAVANADREVLRVASVRVDSVQQAEEAAIALAVNCNSKATVMTDSQKACRNFAQGTLGRPASRIL